MPPKKKQRFMSLSQQQQAINDFIENISDDEETHFDDNAPFIGSDSEDEEPIIESESDSDDNEEFEQAPRKQKFKSIDDCANEENYDPVLEQPDETFSYTSADKKFSMTWHTNVDIYAAGRNPSANIILGKEGPRGPAKNVRTPIDAFSCYITDEILEEMLLHTNNKINRFIEQFREALATSKYSYVKEVTLPELKVLIGIIYIRTALQLNIFRTRDVFFHESSNDIFQSVMSYNRFAFVLRFLEFDDKDIRPGRWEEDKYAAIRSFFEKVNVNNAKLRVPSPYVSVDETLYPYRGKIGMKQYNPSKPAKYGLLYRSLCDAKVPYTYYTLPYADNPNVIGNNDYYVTRCDEYTKWPVNYFQEHGSLHGRNISLDRFFTSVTLADWCLENHITIVGTMKSYRKAMPKEMKAMDGREEKSIKFCYSDDKKMMLLSYINKKKNGKKKFLRLQQCIRKFEQVVMKERSHKFWFCTIIPKVVWMW